MGRKERKESESSIEEREKKIILFFDEWEYLN